MPRAKPAPLSPAALATLRVVADHHAATALANLTDRSALGRACNAPAPPAELDRVGQHALGVAARGARLRDLTEGETRALRAFGNEALIPTPGTPITAAAHLIPGRPTRPPWSLRVDLYCGGYAGHVLLARGVHDEESYASELRCTLPGDLAIRRAPNAVIDVARAALPAAWSAARAIGARLASFERVAAISGPYPLGDAYGFAYRAVVEQQDDGSSITWWRVVGPVATPLCRL